jgi:hypothetical protein
MALTLVAERREPSGESSKNKEETVGLAPLRYNADSKVSAIGRIPAERSLTKRSPSTFK